MNRLSMQKAGGRTTVMAILAASALVLTGPLRGAIVGQWDFDNGNLTATLGGQPLTYIDGAGGATETGTQFQSVDIGGQPAKVMAFPACTRPMGYGMPAPAAANGDGFLVNQWTLLLDVMYPPASDKTWRAFIEVDQGVTPDSDLFVNPANGIGVSGNYSGQIISNVWHRVAFVIDQAAGVNQIRKYIDGVEVGVQAAGALDGRWAMSPAGFSELFNDDGTDVAPGYVNSIQLHDAALTRQQIAAYGGATAAGLPTTIPKVPSSIDRWIPAGANGMATAPVGVVIHDGDTIIQDSSIVLKLDNVTLTSPTITRTGDLIEVKKAPPSPLAISSKHTVEITYVDDLNGTKTASHQFTVAVFLEDFESLTLGPNEEETTAGEKVWTKTPPTGWTIDDSGMPGFAEPDYSTLNGVNEFSGWTFLSVPWWVQTAGNQDRINFTKAKGTLAVADPDEWDDSNGGGHYQGLFNSYMTTGPISLQGVAAGTAVLQFDSSWRPEAQDDGPPGFPEGNINNQTAVIKVTYDAGQPTEIIRWESVAGPNYKADAIYENETATVQLNNPAGATSMTLTFGLLLAANDWWWAIDNILVTAGDIAPAISQDPASASRIVGTSVGFTVLASGTSLAYQWQKNGVDIPGANTSAYNLTALKKSDGGKYRCVVSNSAGTATSQEATLTVLDVPDNADSLKVGLGAYLPFDTDYNDISGNNRHGTAVGEPSIGAGRVGAGALKVTTSRADASYNFVSLGLNGDLPFGQTEDFTVAFWVKVDRLTGDPSFVATKSWASGGNNGWTIGSQTNGEIEWNYKRSDAARRDLDYTAKGNILNNGQWNHVVVVWKINGNAETYYNGELVDSRDISPGTGDVADPSLAFNLGEDGTGAYNGGDWDGLLDDVAIWTRALTANEVLTLYSFAYFGDNFFTAPPLTADLGTLLKLDGDYQDASGSGANGTPMGTLAFNPGRVGQAVHINTTRSATVQNFNYVALGNAANVRFGETKDFSVLFWAKLNQWAADPAFIANKNWGSGGNTGWVIATDGDGRVQWNYRRAGDASLVRKDFDSVGGVFSDLGWHHIAVVFNINGQAVTYIDGNEVALDRGGAAARKDISPGIGTLLDPTLSLNVGEDGTGHYSDDHQLDALMDEVGIWGRALSGREVAVAYNRGINGQSIDGSTPSVQPTLVYQVAGGQMTLTWEGTGFTLQQNASVANAAGWSAVPGAGANSAVIPIGAGSQYFRLTK